MGRIVDAGEEMVCSSCGTVTAKEVIEMTELTEERVPQAVDFTTHALGSFLGPLEYGHEEVFSRGLSGSPSTFKYLKTISDFSYKEGAAVYGCARLIERVCEKLVLPKSVVVESVCIAKSVMEMRRGHGEITIAAISAFAIINACKRLRVSSAGLREIVEAHRNLGYRVKGSVIIQISIDAPIRSRPRRAEEYVANVMARLKSVLDEEEGVPKGYLGRLHEAARIALENVDGPSRGGHNPRAMAATAVYAGEIALATHEDRKKIISQREIASCVEVAEYTVREQFVEIFRPRMGRILDSVRSQRTPHPARTTETHPSDLRVPPLLS